MNIFCLVCWKKEFLKARGKKSHFLSITLACLETRLNTRERTMSHMKNLFSRIGAKIWSSVPDSDRALKFKNTLQSWLLNILIGEDTYVGLRTLIDSLISFISCFIYLFWNICILCLINFDNFIVMFQPYDCNFFYFSFPPQLALAYFACKDQFWHVC